MAEPGRSELEKYRNQNVEEMVMRDRNHPSIVTWGVRVNESGDDSALYTSTNNKARSLDSRPTCGVRNFKTSQFLEDLYTYNDFSGGIDTPTQQPWLVTEFAGHTFPTHSYDAEQRLIDHALKHAYIQNDSTDAKVSGAMGWCAFDYNTTNLFGDPTNTYVCYHGVSDIFRLPKFAAYFYKSQVDPVKYGYNVYIANYWKSNSPTTVTVFSNCPQVELFVNGVSKGIKSPTLYTNLPHGVFQWTDHLCSWKSESRWQERFHDRGNVYPLFTGQSDKTGVNPGFHFPNR